MLRVKKLINYWIVNLNNNISIELLENVLDENYTINKVAKHKIIKLIFYIVVIIQIYLLMFKTKP